MKFAFMSDGVTSGIIATAVTVTVVAIMIPCYMSSKENPLYSI